jgi:hypothetical protein
MPYYSLALDDTSYGNLNTMHHSIILKAKLNGIILNQGQQSTSSIKLKPPNLFELTYNPCHSALSY